MGRKYRTQLEQSLTGRLTQERGLRLDSEPRALGPIASYAAAVRSLWSQVAVRGTQFVHTKVDRILENSAILDILGLVRVRKNERFSGRKTW